MTDATQSSPAETPGPTVRTTASRILSVLAPFIGLAVVMLLFYAMPPHHPLTKGDLRVIAVHTVIVGICAMGMTLIIISGGIDLSVGSAIALVSVTVALALKAGCPVALAVVIALVAGAACGLYNGLLITLLRLPPFIATLGTMLFFRGLAKYVAGSRPVNAPAAGLDKWMQSIPDQDWLLFAPGVWLMLALAVFMIAVLRYTLLGRYAFAIGSNEPTARLCGIRVNRTKVLIYVVAGGFVGLGALLQFARLTQGDPTIAVGMELEVIAAVVIGGASLSGGQGSIVGTMIGAFLMAYLANRCVAYDISTAVQEIVVGHVILVAVAIDQWRVRRTGR